MQILLNNEISKNNWVTDILKYQFQIIWFLMIKHKI